MRLKEIFEKLNRANDGSRSLFESIVVPEVDAALRDWSRVDHGCVLIGGCALSFYGRPRTTTDVDVLFLNANDIPSTVPNFKRTRPSAFQHNPTHVEIEVTSPAHINVSDALAKKVFETAKTSDGVRIASPEGLVALKLVRWSRQDQADIEALMKQFDIDLSDWPIDTTSEERFAEAKTWLESA